MIDRDENTAPRRDAVSGALLIAASLAMMIVLSFHPRAHDLMTSQTFARQAARNEIVHGLALAAVPALFLGLLGLSRRLGWTDSAVAATVVYGFGSVAVMTAAIASGFLATDMIESMLEEKGAARDAYHALLDYTGHLNQAFANVNLVATAIALILWSSAILRTRRLSRAAGIAGVVIGAVILAAFFSGHLKLTVHGFGIVILAQSAWLIWVGLLLHRPPPD